MDNMKLAIETFCRTHIWYALSHMLTYTFLQIISPNLELTQIKSLDVIIIFAEIERR